jgi:hypothetical protein
MDLTLPTVFLNNIMSSSEGFFWRAMFFKATDRIEKYTSIIGEGSEF